jgi:lysine N6-hydroxylase
MTQPLDLAGIGIGPFNLSLAALLDPIQDQKVRFFDRRAEFAWHPGMMLANTTLQTSWLKDLVAAADPTSRYSFLAYLVAKKRLYRFISAEFSAILRIEFADYMAWVAGQLKSLAFNESVQSVAFGSDNLFHLELDSGPVRARNLAIATGPVAYTPDWAGGMLGPECLHSGRYLLDTPPLAGRHVLVVGGGQSGAEIVLSLLTESPARAPSGITWISRRPTFAPIDEAPFTNEFFMPGYVQAFLTLPAHRKERIVASQKLASDGISHSTLTALYQRLYELVHLEGRTDYAELLPFREATGLERAETGYRLTLRNGFDGGIEAVKADVVVLATGYQVRLPTYLDGLRGRLHLDADERFVMGDDYSVVWDGPADRRIFAQNVGRQSFGIADPQLSLMAWRSATIVNALVERTLYDVEGDVSLLRWTSANPPPEGFKLAM